MNLTAQPANSQYAAAELNLLARCYPHYAHYIYIFVYIAVLYTGFPVYHSPAAPTYSRDESALRLFALCLCHRTTKHCFMRFKSLSFSLYAFLQFVNINRGVFLSPRHRMIFHRSVADLSVSVPACGCSEKAVGFALSAIRWRTFSVIRGYN